MTRQIKIAGILLFSTLIFLTTSCKKQVSPTTGWRYNDPKNGGFEVNTANKQVKAPGLVFIEGGTFIMGNTQEDIRYEWNNIPRRVTVNSFYMDETEVSNIAYLEYLYWLDRVFGADYPMVYVNALPDTLVWRDKLAYNDPLVEYYFRHPSYKDYPVVGVNWVQANDFCTWRTDRVNELLLIKAGVLKFDPDQKNENNFNTDAYLAGQYEGVVNKPLPDLNPNGTGERRAKMEDNIMVPKYRLPTEAEWEYAAIGIVGNTLNERVVERKNYPWNGNYLRSSERKNYGSFMDNFKRGSGDYMGVAKNLNDGASIPAPCGSYWPNDFGLYNMAGNVSEWVQDVYRPLSGQDVTDLSPYRGNDFKVPLRNAEGTLEPKDSLGRIRYREITPEECANRRNFRKANNINYLDGDLESTISTDWKTQPADGNTTKLMYDYGKNSLISDKTRVYKGGSWKDGPYYLSPCTRRYLDQNEATNYIGFRCAMNRVGSPSGK